MLWRKKLPSGNPASCLFLLIHDCSVSPFGMKLTEITPHELNKFEQTEQSFFMLTQQYPIKIFGEHFLL